MYSKVIINSTVYQMSKKLIDMYGFAILWGYSEDFEIAASVCITLADLRKRWPSMSEEFIAKNMMPNGKALPIAGLRNIYEDKESYNCKPISGYFEYLTLPKEHQEYTNRFARSYQCFAQQYDIIDFVLPLYKIEEYEKEHPELLRPVESRESNTENPFENIELQELIKALASFPQDILLNNRKSFLAALLHSAKIPAKLVHPLLSGKAKVDLNGMQKYVSRYAKKAHELLEQERKTTLQKK